MTIVDTEKVRNYLKTNAKYMKKPEVSYSLQILRNLSFKKQYSETLNHFNYLRNKKLKHHKPVAMFAFKVFEACGAEYTEVLVKNNSIHWNLKKFL